MGGRWGLKGRSGCRGVAPFGEGLATTQAQNDTRLEFLKNNQKRTAVTMPQAAPVWEFQCPACPQRGAGITLVPWNRFWAWQRGKVPA